MNTDHRPSRRTNIETINRPGEQMLYDPDSGEVHQLNPSSMAIWESCDGLTTPLEIAGAISELSGAPVERAVEDVNTVLREFMSLGLLSTVESSQLEDG